MPLLFDYKCPYCSNLEIDRIVQKYDEPVHCNECEQLMTKQLAAPAVNGGFADGFRPAFREKSD